VEHLRKAIGVDFDELKQLIRILEESGLSELEIEEEGRRIRLQKPGAAAPAPVAAPAAPNVQPMVVDAGGPVSAASDDDDDIADGLPTINSPMVGTFYRSPSPDADPFVTVGDRVDENQTVCIVEAMKLMNEVGAKISGVIEKVLVENAQPVEFGQPLFAVRPLD
jgi:acetyl-CoA carboxylase biotin carboxyl carrier protein